MNKVFKTAIVGLMVLSAVIASGAIYTYLVQTNTNVTVLSGLYFDGAPTNEVTIHDSISLYPGDNQSRHHTLVLNDNVTYNATYQLTVDIDEGLYFSLENYDSNLSGLGTTVDGGIWSMIDITEIDNTTYEFTLEPNDCFIMEYNVTADNMIAAGVYSVNTTINRI